MVKLGDKVEKKRSKTLICSIIAFAIICILASYIKDKNSVNVYDIQSISDESALIIKNLKLVELGDKLYLDRGCTINVAEGFNSEDIKEISIDCYIDNKEVYKSSLDTVSGGTSDFINIPTIIRHVKMNSNSTFTMKMSYTMAGENKETNKDIKLEDWESECNIYN